MKKLAGVILIGGLTLYITLFYMKPQVVQLAWSNYTTNDDKVVVSEQNFYRTSIGTLNQTRESRKVILRWHWNDPGNKDLTLPSYCGSCKITYDVSRINDANVSAVVLLYKYAKPKRMPDISKRRPDQLYIWWTGESTSNLLHNKFINLTFLDQIGFNATSSYRRDSDFPRPYAIAWRKMKMMKPQNKTKLAVAVVSDCHATVGATARLKYLKKFQTQFPLDGYGRCFENILTREEALSITRQYKFYFAFENSYHCRDYITEKLTVHALQSNSIPVVWGATKEDYEARIPPGSFIFVEDYQPMEKLIEYLHYLDKNDTAYLQYFKWRENIPEEWFQQEYGLCAICKNLNGINYSTFLNFNTTSKFSAKNISFSQWFLDENRECFTKNIEIK